MGLGKEISGTNLKDLADEIQFHDVRVDLDEEIRDITVFFDFKGIKGFSFKTNKRDCTVGDVSV